MIVDLAVCRASKPRSVLDRLAFAEVAVSTRLGYRDIGELVSIKARA
ncbi:hypothetical protein ACIA3K_23020 [Micromonospora sp. NPDC051543]